MAEISNYIVENNHQFVVANKPAAMPCVPDKTGDQDLKTILEQYVKADLHVITRIDRPVSGLVLFAKKKTAAHHLTEQIRKKQIAKTYIAVVEKKIEKAEQDLSHFLTKVQNKAIITTEATEGSKPASLHYETIQEYDNYTGVKVSLNTGRFHQIRSQLAFIGHPIKGDVKYGARRKNQGRFIHLHAYGLSFINPGNEQQVNFKVAPDAEDSLFGLIAGL